MRSKPLKYAAGLAFIPFIIFLLAFSPARRLEAKADQPVFDTDKFSITIPPGWKHSTRTVGGYTAFFLNAPPADNFSANINILSENMQGLSKKAYIDLNKEKMKGANFVFDGEANFASNTMQGYYMSSTFDYNGRKLSTNTYLFIKGNLAYIVTGTCLLNQKAFYLPVFNRTIKTFKIK